MNSHEQTEPYHSVVRARHFGIHSLELIDNFTVNVKEAIACTERGFYGVSLSTFAINLVENLTTVLSLCFEQGMNLLQSQVESLFSSGSHFSSGLQAPRGYHLEIDRQMLEANGAIVEELVLSLEAKDVYTHRHCLNVARLSKLTAIELGLSEKEAQTIYIAGLLHDIGKTGLNERLLNKSGELSVEELNALKSHTIIGKKILNRFPFLDHIIPLVLYHHERFDGSGCPEGIKGQEIPLGSRILAVTDSFDAMISERTNNGRMAMSAARTEISCNTGILFDPEIADAFIAAWEKYPHAFVPSVVPKNETVPDTFVLKTRRTTGISNGRLRYEQPLSALLF